MGIPKILFFVEVIHQPLQKVWVGTASSENGDVIDGYHAPSRAADRLDEEVSPLGPRDRHL